MSFIAYYFPSLAVHSARDSTGIINFFSPTGQIRHIRQFDKFANDTAKCMAAHYESLHRTQGCLYLSDCDFIKYLVIK